MDDLVVHAIGFVRSDIKEAGDDYWGDVVCTIEVDPRLGADALRGLEEFSHVEILFHLSKVDPAKITATRHPRNREDLPEIGVFAQRAKVRPNRVGATICPIVKVEGARLTVRALDAIDGTPVLDIKPVLRQFYPRQEDIRQPAWTEEVMRHYFAPRGDRK